MKLDLTLNKIYIKKFSCQSFNITNQNFFKIHFSLKSMNQKFISQKLNNFML